MSFPFAPLGLVFTQPADARLHAWLDELNAATVAAELEPRDALLAWSLARWAGPSAAPPAVEALTLALLSAEREGSTHLPLEPRLLRAHLTALALNPAWVTAALGCAKAVRALTSADALPGKTPTAGLLTIAGPPGARTPLIVDEGRLYSERVHAMELRCAAALARRLQTQPALFDAAAADLALQDVLARPSRFQGKTLALTPSQASAVSSALRRGLCVISGGPGTGKTTNVVSLLRVLTRLGVSSAEIALTAPTGKAAARMADSVRSALHHLDTPADADLALREAPPDATTLHRLLRYSPSTERFLHHAGNPIGAQVVVVDEASMIDLALMDRLLRALRPDAHLVLLGDADQLPSVEAGSVLRDLAPHVAVRLRESHRMDARDPAGRAIFQLAESIRSGDARAVFPAGEGELFIEPARVTARESVQALMFSGAELLEDASMRAELCARHYVERLRGGELLEQLRREPVTPAPGQAPMGEEARAISTALSHFAQARVLCITRDDTRRVNAALHAHAQAEQPPAFASGPFGPCEPVLVLANDYERGLWNGDQGVTVALAGRAGPTLHVAFAQGEGLALHPLAAMRGNVELAYASTVHKSQGSEMDHVILWLPLGPHRLCTRELVYTAVTRARRSVVIAGPRAVLEGAIARPVARHSALGERVLRLSQA